MTNLSILVEAITHPTSVVDLIKPREIPYPNISDRTLTRQNEIRGDTPQPSIHDGACRVSGIPECYDGSGETGDVGKVE